MTTDMALLQVKCTTGLKRRPLIALLETIIMESSFLKSAAAQVTGADILALEFSENPEKIIYELARCVKPKGRLLFGVLNSLSSYNQKRQNNAESVYVYGQLFSPKQLKNLLERFGTVKMRIAGFVIRSKWLIWLSPLYEGLCRFIGSKKDAFIAAEVQL